MYLDNKDKKNANYFKFTDRALFYKIFFGGCHLFWVLIEEAESEILESQPT